MINKRSNSVLVLSRTESDGGECRTPTPASQMQSEIGFCYIFMVGLMPLPREDSPTLAE